jgi:hypothetical protein
MEKIKIKEHMVPPCKDERTKYTGGKVPSNYPKKM